MAAPLGPEPGMPDMGGFGGEPGLGGGDAMGMPQMEQSPPQATPARQPTRSLDLRSFKAILSFVLTALAAALLAATMLSAPFISSTALSFVAIDVPSRSLSLSVGLFGTCITGKQWQQCTEPTFGGFQIASFGLDEPRLVDALSGSQTYWLFLPMLCCLVTLLAVVVENTHLLLFVCLLGATMLSWATIAVEIALFTKAVSRINNTTSLHAQIGYSLWFSAAASLFVTAALGLHFETHVWRSCRPSEIDYGNDDGRSQADEDEPKALNGPSDPGMGELGAGDGLGDMGMPGAAETEPEGPMPPTEGDPAAPGEVKADGEKQAHSHHHSHHHDHHEPHHEHRRHTYPKHGHEHGHHLRRRSSSGESSKSSRWSSSSGGSESDRSGSRQHLQLSIGVHQPHRRHSADLEKGYGHHHRR